MNELNIQMGYTAFNFWGAPHPSSSSKIGRPPTSGKMVQLVEHRHINPDVAGSNPAVLNYYLLIQGYWMLNLNSCSKLRQRGLSSYQVFLGEIACIKMLEIHSSSVTLRGVILGYTAFLWLNDFLTIAPLDKDIDNRETANIGLDSQLVENRHVNLLVAGSSPVLLNCYLLIPKQIIIGNIICN